MLTDAGFQPVLQHGHLASPEFFTPSKLDLGIGHDSNYYIRSCHWCDPQPSLDNIHRHSTSINLISRMVNIDASTPQLKVLQKWLNAFDSLDANNLDPVLSKNYRHETFPKSIGLPEEGKEEHIERYKKTLPSLSKFGVCIQY